MEKISRSKSSKEDIMIQPITMNGLRINTTSTYNSPPPYLDYSKDLNFKNVKNKKGNKCSNDNNGSWNLDLDNELLRKKRVYGYKAYEVESNMKDLLKRSFRWIKDTCNQVAHGKFDKSL